MHMYFHMSPSFNYAPVHNLQQTSVLLSFFCNDNLTEEFKTETLMSPVAAWFLRSPSRGSDSQTNLCFTVGV